MLTQNSFGPKFFFDPKYFLFQNNFRSRKFWVETIFGSKKFGSNKITPTFLDQKKYGQKTLGSKNLGQQTHGPQKVIWWKLGQ